MTPQGSHHPSKLLFIWAKNAVLPCLSIWHLLEKTHSTWSTRQIHHSPMTGLTLLPPQHTPADSWHCHYLQAYTRRHTSTGSYNVERSCDKSWGDGKVRESRQLERGLDIYEVGWFRRYIADQDSYLRPLSEDLQPLHTCPIQDWPTGCLVSTQMICISTSIQLICCTSQLSTAIPCL